MKYKIYCSNCQSQILDSTRYIKAVYMDGQDKTVTLACPACHQEFTVKEELTYGKKHNNRKAG